MSAPLILAVPSKGRLQQNAEAFFARSGLELVKQRGARDYRGAIAGFDGVEIAYLSAAEITAQLAQGAVHLGVTGEDLVREMIVDADRKVVFIDQLGGAGSGRTFGGARAFDDAVIDDAMFGKEAARESGVFGGEPHLAFVL